MITFFVYTYSNNDNIQTGHQTRKVVEVLVRENSLQPNQESVPHLPQWWPLVVENCNIRSSKYFKRAIFTSHIIWLYNGKGKHVLTHDYVRACTFLNLPQLVN